MKKLGFISLLCLFILAACNAPQETQEDDNGGGTIENLCSSKSTNDCDMKWIVTYSRNNFPQSIEIRVNGKKVYNECVDTQFGITRGASQVEIVMWNFVRLKDSKTKFSFEIKRIPDCAQPVPATFDFNEVQDYTIEEIDGEEVVRIKN